MTDDIDQIMHVMDQAFDPNWGEAWNRRQISDSLVMPNINYRLVSSDGSPPTESEPAAGFILVRSAPGEEELLLIAVNPERRGKGLGLTLLNGFARDAKSRGAEHIYLEMRANNPALSLYKSFGFEQIGLRKDYYRTAQGGRIDAITFGKKI